MTESRVGKGLADLPISNLNRMQDMADQNGYSGGYPLGAITAELIRRRRQPWKPSSISIAERPVIVRPVFIVPTADQIGFARYPFHARWSARNARSRL